MAYFSNNVHGQVNGCYNTISGQSIGYSSITNCGYSSIIGGNCNTSSSYCSKEYVEIQNSKELMIKFVMDYYKITEEDLKNSSIIREKIRDIKLDNIINKSN